jgi:hypothetical protein
MNREESSVTKFSQEFVRLLSEDQISKLAGRRLAFTWVKIEK